MENNIPGEDADQLRGREKRTIRLVLKAKGEPLVVEDRDGITTISRFVAVPDKIWDSGDWASYQPSDDFAPSWVESPSSRFVAGLMTERMVASADAGAIRGAVDDARALLAEGDFDGLDNLLTIMGEAANFIARTLSKPLPEALS